MRRADRLRKRKAESGSFMGRRVRSEPFAEEKCGERIVYGKEMRRADHLRKRKTESVLFAEEKDGERIIYSKERQRADRLKGNAESGLFTEEKGGEWIIYSKERQRADRLREGKARAPGMRSSEGRKLYSPAEAYEIMYRAMMALPFVMGKGRGRTVDQAFRERLMLAVTEVNGCALCAYGHTKMALESGMNRDEIQSLLNGVMDGIPSAELPAVLFAQHYADMRGRPSREAWSRITAIYGKSAGRSILSAIQVIMAGNTFGIPAGSFVSRIVKTKCSKTDKRSSIPYEICMIACALPFAAAAFAHAVAASFLHRPYIRFGD